MSQIITAPSTEEPLYTSVFLAGGISNCREWQKDVIEELEYDNISIFNPRRENFESMNKKDIYEQIQWEYERLERMDIFSMYFCDSDSVQPICLYELGRNVLRMQNRFPADWQNRIAISIEEGYKRKDDVIIQMSLCAPQLFIYCNADPATHAQYISHAKRVLLRGKQTWKKY